MADKGIAGARLTKLGRYEVLSELGKGAMGIVYLAKDPVIGRMVAIKTIRASNMGDDDSESREFRERFIREAQTAGILSHPNIVTIHDIGEDSESQTSFIAMEYIEGKNLKSLLVEKTTFTYDQIADMIAQVAEAIDYAHRKGIIHRDIKPANVIITTDQKVKITDFGIAKVASSNLTTTGQFLGTPNYMSPEQVSGAPVDGRSDIFSLGVVLYELLTKRKPFMGENLTAISYKIVHEDFTPPAELASEVPPEFNPIVARAMAKDPWNRYQRGKDFALALHQLRAHLEEQKALADLGTIVSEAEFIPTLRLANLEQLAAKGAAERRETGEMSTPRRSTEMIPPTPEPDSSRPTASLEPPAEGSAASGAPLDDHGTLPPRPAAPSDARTQVLDASPMTPPPPMAPPAEYGGKMRGRAMHSTPAEPSTARPIRTPVPPVLPITRPKTPTTRAKKFDPVLLTKKAQDFLRSQDWGKLRRSEVNPYWFWRVVAGLALLVVLIAGALLIQRAVVSRPTAPVDQALVAETEQRKQSLAQGKRLFNAGRYEESLGLFRKVLARSPNNQEARQYTQMAENAAQGRQDQARRQAQANQVLEAAQAAFGQGNYEEAQRRADEVLALDGGRVEAQRIREESSTKIAEASTAAAAAAKKKAAARPAQVARKAPAPAPETRSDRGAAPTAAPASAATGGMLRLLFNSPISEGNVMVAVNDQILLRRQFSFKRRESIFKTVKETGTVDESIPVKSGPLAVKVWLSGPDIPASILATTNGQMPGGETRILRVDYSGGHLSARIQ